MRPIQAIGFLVLLGLLLSGCGETWGGFKRDTGRIAKGIKTIFVSSE